MPAATHRILIPRGLQGLDGLIAAHSTRLGGVSKGPYASLNLGLHTDDDPAAVDENRRRFFGDLGIEPGQVAGAYQVHGCQVAEVERPGQLEGYDALVTDRPGVYLTVTVADCTPILVADPVRRAVAAIHAGWRGTVAGIAGKALETMRDRFGTDPAACLAWIGPCIDACTFEVDADVADHFEGRFKKWDPERKKFFVDLKAANRAQLLEAGLPPDRVEVSPLATVIQVDRFFSHRAEGGHTGRMLALIGWRS